MSNVYGQTYLNESKVVETLIRWTDNEVQTRVENWLKTQVAVSYDELLESWYHASKNIAIKKVTTQKSS